MPDSTKNLPQRVIKLGSYIPSTKAERGEMLSAIGLSDINGLYADVPDSAMFKGLLDLPEGLSELEVRRKMTEIAKQNRVFSTILRGAGSYDHYIPSIVKFITSKEEFVTAYTPYQAELSQGILQSIFEYQTMICSLTGMDVSNASVYDGATAAAEAAAMCVNAKRRTVLISDTAHPDTISVVKTYCFGTDTDVIIIPGKDGKTDISALESMLTETSAAVYIQQPNFFGLIEDAARIGEIAHSSGAKFIMGCNPISLSIMKTPAECGADVAVGEGQPLGIPMSYGGPYLGFMAAEKSMMRHLPGRIVGETVDSDGNRAFVLTLQAREQHIRREKASSNICSNQALCAFTAAVYMSVMGPDGIREAAEQSMSKAHYFAESLCKIKGISMANSGCYFNEFLTKTETDPALILKKLEEAGILGGLPLKDGILWCVTEKVEREKLDEAVDIVREVCK